jgi:hypothetical protein
MERPIDEAGTVAAPAPNPYFGIFDEALNVGRLYTSFMRALLAESDQNRNDPE